MLLAGSDARLAGVRSVYLLPMANGLDQHLANRLTNLGVFQVVTDPQKAEAVFTDRLGEAFETRLNELYPPPVEKKEEEEEATDAKKELKQPPPPSSAFTRGKGTLFLVDVKSRNVLWSIYERPKNTTSGELDRSAERIAQRLKKDLGGK